MKKRMLSIVLMLVMLVSVVPMPQAGAAVQALEGLSGNEDHENGRDDPRDENGPEVFENHAVGDHEAHAVGYEEERHRPEQEAGRRTYAVGRHPFQTKGGEEQDHADDVARDIAARQQAQGVAREPEKEDVEESRHKCSSFFGGRRCTSGTSPAKKLRNRSGFGAMHTLPSFSGGKYSAFFIFSSS